MEYTLYTLRGGSRCRRGAPQEGDTRIFSDFPSKESEKTGTQKRQAGQWPGGCPGSTRGSGKGKSGRCQKAMAPAVGVRGGTGKGRSNARADSPGARETSPRRCVAEVRAPVLGQSGVNKGGSRPQRGWSQSSSGLPALLDLRGLAIIRDDLRPRGPALPQPVCLAHSAGVPGTPPPAPALSGAARWPEPPPPGARK